MRQQSRDARTHDAEAVTFESLFLSLFECLLRGRVSRNMIAIMPMHKAKMNQKFTRGLTENAASSAPMIPPTNPARLHRPWKAAMMLRR